jgi:hypothetical protein
MPSLITPRELHKWVPGMVFSGFDVIGCIFVEQRTYRFVGLYFPK